MKKQITLIENKYGTKTVATITLTDEYTYGENLLENGEPFIFILNDKNKDEDTFKFPYVYMGDDMPPEDYLLNIYKRFKKLPWNICETDRLYIRESTISDVDEFIKIYEDKEISRYTDDLLHPFDREREYAKEYIKNVYEFYGYGVWSVCLKDTGEVIGRAGISRRPGQEEAELGFVFGKKYQHKGYAYEATKAIIDYAFNELFMNSLLAWTNKENIPSINLMKRLGMVPYSENEDLISYIYMRQ